MFIESSNKVNSNEEKLSSYLKRLEYDKSVRKRNNESLSKSKNKKRKEGSEDSPSSAVIYPRYSSPLSHNLIEISVRENGTRCRRCGVTLLSNATRQLSPSLIVMHIVS